MPLDVNLISAFLVALLGGVHCVGMCGGIVGALTLGLPDKTRQRFGLLIPYLLAYNSGRIASYVAAGAVMGGVGAAATGLTVVHGGQLVLQVIAGLFMIALGLYVAGWWRGLAAVEHVAGRVVWKRIEPLGRQLLPVRRPGQAFLVGLVWGWLPCGLVYSVLVWSISTGDVVRGALLMLSFGLGTLPALLTMGTAAGQLTRYVRRPGVRRSAGALVIVFGAYYALLALGLWPRA